MGVNFFGVVHGIHSFLPHLVAQREGHIVNTASMAGLLAGPWMAPYNASKHAVVAVSESIYHELATIGSPVGVSVLCPGYVRTRIAESDRNWQQKYGPPPDSEETSAKAIRDAARNAIETGLDPAIVAAAVRDAIVTNQFWILTHPEFSDRVLVRYGAAAEGRNPPDVTLA
jgi:short-subunit dehydrogenase